MAETLTYDSGTDTVTDGTGQNLTPAEQESLAVGTELESQQEQLLAGKYKDAADLEKAYIELQKKLGDNDNAGSLQESKETTEEEVTDTKSEEPDEVDTSKDYNEDGTVNYAEVSEAYGKEISAVMEKAGVDPWAIIQEFHYNEGAYTPEMMKQLTDAGCSECAVKSYFAGRAVEAGYINSSASDISDMEVQNIQQEVGGTETYNNIIGWASQNLTKTAIEAFDNTMSTGSLDQIRLAVAGLQSQYENATGYEGTMYSGKAAQTSKDTFRSQAELVAAMSDRRYDNDPAYRQDVIEKLDRSDLEF